MVRNKKFALIIIVLILYANVADAFFVGALISGAMAIGKMAAKFAIKAATDAAKNAIREAMRKKREDARNKKRQEEFNRKRKQKEGKVKKSKEAKSKELIPDEPSDLDDYDMELMEAIIAYKAQHKDSPYVDGHAQYPKLNKISQKDLRHLANK